MIKKILLLSTIYIALFQISYAQYCTPSFALDCTSDDIIDEFSTTGGVSNITNLGSGCSGFPPNNYTFNNTMTVSQTQGLPVNFTVASSGFQTQGFAIWVDWNQDYDFDDVGEDVYNSGFTGFTFSSLIPVPTTAHPGITRMRIISGRFGPPLQTDYCNSFLIYGECEDYNFEVLGSAACAGMPIAGTVTPAGPLTLCSGQVVHLGLTGSSVTSGLIYNWQQAPTTAGPWINVIGGFGGTGPGYVTPALSTTTWYRCTISCGALSATTPHYSINVTTPVYVAVPYAQSFENWMSQCDVNDVPDDNHWANSPLTGNASWRREDDGASAAWLNPSDGFYLPSASLDVHSARYHSYGTTVPGDMDLYLNCSLLPGDKTVTFDYINTNFTGIGFDSLEVLLSTNGGGFFNTLGYFRNANTWQNNALIVSSNTANTILRFRGLGDNQFHSDMGLDNIVVMSPCSGSPNAGVIDPIVPCSNIPFNLTLTGASIGGGITYDWESAPAATGPWTNIGTTAAPILNTTVTSSTYFRCTVLCQASGVSNVTPVIFAPLATFYDCYCSSLSTTNTLIRQNIGNITMFNSQNVAILNNGTATPLLNNPAPLSYYTNYSSMTPTTVYKDSVYDLSITTFSKNPTYTNGYSKVYIDWNKDGIFDPFTENIGGGIFDVASQSLNLTFTVPSSSQLGITGMRVVYHAGGSPSTTNPCGTYPNGETEDYLIEISLAPCLTPPYAGIASISDTVTCPGYVLYLEDVGHDLTYLNLTFNWQYSSDGIIYNDIAGAVFDTLSYTVNNEAWFRFRTTCNGTSNGYSNVLHVVMNPPFACYGQSSATGGPLDSTDVGALIISDSTTTNNIHSYITGGPHLQNANAVKNRTDRTSFGPMQLYTDSVYQFAIYSILKTKTHADAKVTIFIDYNNNQIYDIPQERIFLGFADLANFYLTGYVRTPAFPAINTPTGMRVIINNDLSANPASDNGVGLYTSGETEDYLVTFKYKQLTPGAVNDMYSIENIGVYPNPTSGIIYLGLHAKESTNLSIQTLSITGALLSETQFEKVNGNFVTELNMSNYAKGTYLIKINSDRGNFIRRVVVE